MKTDRERDGVRHAGPQQLPVRFEASRPTTINLVVVSTCDDWRRSAAFLPNPFGGRTLNLQGPSSMVRRD